MKIPLLCYALSWAAVQVCCPERRPISRTAPLPPAGTEIKKKVTMRTTVRKHTRGIVLAFLMAVLSVMPLATTAAPSARKYEPKPAEAARHRLKTPITYSCVETPIDTVLMNLAEQAGVDIVKSPKVTGNVTVKVTNVPLTEALTNILAAHDYTYIATESMIRVVPIREVATLREQLVTRIYQVTYADANEVAAALRTFVSQRGQMAFNKGTRHIMVTDTEGKIKAIDKFIEQIDLMTPQVLVEVRIYEITTNEGFELGAEWHAARNTPLKAIDTTKTDIDTDFPTTTEKITTFTETTSGNYRDADDGGPGGSSFTVEGTETEITELPLGTFFDKTTEQYTTRRRKPFAGASFDRIEGGTLSFSLLNSAVDLELALHVLRQQAEARLLANPRVLVLDNETARFEIIREIPYREMRQVGRADPITYTEFKNVGVNLKVTPHVTRDSVLRLHIVPEFGVLVSQDLEGVPTVDTRRADTTAMVRNGQTIAIGGLRKRETTVDISKVPVLADLPLLGGLFKSRTESIKINELIVFITTKIVVEPVLSEIERMQFDQTEFASPRTTRLRLERDSRLRTEPDRDNIEEMLDLLLQDLESPGN